MAADERVAFHDLRVDSLELLMEAEIPCGLDILLNGLLEACVAIFFGPRAIRPAIHVVVAADENLLDMAAVQRAFVVRKHFVPHVGEVLQLLDEAPVRDVARDEHGVDLLLVIPFQRLLPCVRALGIQIDMHVADGTEPQQRLLAFRNRGMQVHPANSRHRRRRGHALQKITPIH